MSVQLVAVEMLKCSPKCQRSLQAAQTDDPLKTADAVVSITVQDVNDNAPTFETADYTETLLENSPANAVVFKAIITDLDEVDLNSKEIKLI